MTKELLLLKKKEDSQTMIEIHNRITFGLFANMERYIRINKLADDLEMNWRTVKTHLEMMSNGYRERNKLSDKIKR